MTTIHKHIADLEACARYARLNPTNTDALVRVARRAAIVALLVETDRAELLRYVLTEDVPRHVLERLHAAGGGA